MSSIAVRNMISSHIAAQAPSEKLVELSDYFTDSKRFYEDAGVTFGNPWLGVEYAGSTEIPITVNALPNKGKYRESGVVMFHVVAQAAVGVTSSILTRAENLRDIFRGRRLVGTGTLMVTEVTPPNMADGGTLDFTDGYTSATFMVAYEYDKDL